jgi:uncharacterized membrane protein (DUF106 family)
MVYLFSKIVTSAFDIIVIPFGAHRTIALAGISLLTGVALIFLFKATSDQERIKRARDKFKARILEMRIYQDDIVLIHKALFAALATNFSYLRASFKPILVLVAFVFVVFVQLDARYGRSPLRPGNHALFAVTLKDGLDPTRVGFDLEAGPGLTVDSPPVRSPADRRIYWRIRADENGTHALKVTVLDKTYTFPVRAEWSNATVGYVRTAGRVVSPLLHPSLPRIPPDSPIEAVELHYPPARYKLLWWRTHWLVVFIVFSFVGALVPKFLFRIEI